MKKILKHFCSFHFFLEKLSLIKIYFGARWNSSLLSSFAFLPFSTSTSLADASFDAESTTLPSTTSSVTSPSSSWKERKKL